MGEVRIMHQIFKRKRLVLVGSESPVLHLAQQRTKGLRLLQPQAHNLNVHKEADQLLGVLGAVGAGRTDDEIVLAGQAIEQSSKDAEEQNVQSDIFAFTERMGLGLQIGRDEQRLDIAGRLGPLFEFREGVVIALQGDAREVVAQRLAPEVQRCGRFFACEPLFLPDREIGELNGQLGQHRL